jgi:hypothetical protein
MPEAPAVTNTRWAIFVSPVFVVFCTANPVSSTTSFLKRATSFA